MSKYKHVYNDIKEKINNGKLKRHTELASENELMKEYGYSKDTIRKALSLLEINGYIQKIRGKNSIILGRGRIKNIYKLIFLQFLCSKKEQFYDRNKKFHILIFHH